MERRYGERYTVGTDTVESRWKLDHVRDVEGALSRIREQTEPCMSEVAMCRRRFSASKSDSNRDASALSSSSSALLSRESRLLRDGIMDSIISRLSHTVSRVWATRGEGSVYPCVQLQAEAGTQGAVWRHRALCGGGRNQEKTCGMFRNGIFS